MSDVDWSALSIIPYNNSFDRGRSYEIMIKATDLETVKTKISSDASGADFDLIDENGEILASWNGSSWTY